MVSIFCSGSAAPAMSTSRRLPYSSYFPSQTSSVLRVESGLGLSGPWWFEVGTPRYADVTVFVPIDVRKKLGLDYRRNRDGLNQVKLNVSLEAVRCASPPAIRRS